MNVRFINDKFLSFYFSFEYPYGTYIEEYRSLSDFAYFLTSFMFDLFTDPLYV